MNAGKTTILLQSSYNYLERGMHTLLLKPSIDNRETESSEIISRIGLKARAESIRPDDDLEAYIGKAHAAKNIDCVFIDEAQFLTPEQVWQLGRVADDIDVPVMCYGLRTDFKGELFPGSATLLAVADVMRELRTLCWCGRKATMTMRKSSSGEAETEGAQIEIGGNERYVSLCRKHWREQNTDGKGAKK